MNQTAFPHRQIVYSGNRVRITEKVPLVSAIKFYLYSRGIIPRLPSAAELLRSRSPCLDQNLIIRRMEKKQTNKESLHHRRRYSCSEQSIRQKVPSGQTSSSVDIFMTESEKKTLLRKFSDCSLNEKPSPPSPSSSPSPPSLPPFREISSKIRLEQRRNTQNKHRFDFVQNKRISTLIKDE